MKSKKPHSQKFFVESEWTNEFTSRNGQHIVKIPLVSSATISNAFMDINGALAWQGASTNDEEGRRLPGSLFG